MPTCNYCGQANTAEAQICVLCGQQLPKVEGADLSKFESTSDDQRSRYETSDAPTGPPPGWGPASGGDAPPPGWGPASSSSWGATAPRVGPVVTKKSKNTKTAKDALAYVKILAVVLVLGIAGYFLLTVQLANTTLTVNVEDVGSESAAGELVILGADGTTLAKKTITDKGDDCGWGRFYQFKIKVKKSASYSVEYKGGTAGPVEPKNGVLTVTTSPGMRVSSDTPRTC